MKFIRKIDDHDIENHIVLYIGIIKVWGFLPKNPPTNQPNIYFVKIWQYWLGIAKSKNVFRSTLNLFKNSSLTHFSSDRLSD